jgi:hypothetical protein
LTTTMETTNATTMSAMSDWLSGDSNRERDLIIARLDSLSNRIDQPIARDMSPPVFHRPPTRVYFRRKVANAIDPRPYREENAYVLYNHEDIVMTPYTSIYYETKLDFEAERNVAATIIGHPLRFTEAPSVIPSHFIRQTPGAGLCLELYNYSHNNIVVRRGNPMAIIYFTQLEEITMVSRPSRNMAESPRLPARANWMSQVVPQPDYPPPPYRRHPQEAEIEAHFFIGSSDSSPPTSEDEYDPGPPDPESEDYYPGTPDPNWTSSISSATSTLDQGWTSSAPSTPRALTNQRTRATRSPSYSPLSSETSRLTALEIRQALESAGNTNEETIDSDSSVRTDTSTVPLEEDDGISFSAVLHQEDLAYGSTDPAHQPRDDLLESEDDMPELERPMDLPNGMDASRWTMRWVRESNDLINWVHLPETSRRGGNEDWGWN